PVNWPANTTRDRVSERDQHVHVLGVLEVLVVDVAIAKMEAKLDIAWNLVAERDDPRKNLVPAVRERDVADALPHADFRANIPLDCKLFVWDPIADCMNLIEKLLVVGRKNFPLGARRNVAGGGRGRRRNAYLKTGVRWNDAVPLKPGKKPV